MTPATAPPLFESPVLLTGPWRSPRQMLNDQVYDGHSSIHDDATAEKLGFSGAPIEGPTHFSQFVPLLATLWGTQWFEKGCISVHYAAPVVEGEEAQASVQIASEGTRFADLHMVKRDGTTVLSGTASVGSDHPATEATTRMGKLRAPERLVILDQLKVGQVGAVRERVRMDFDQFLGEFYPFTLAQKLDRITEPIRWYEPDAGAASPWGAPIVPLEMISVLSNYTVVQAAGFAIRQPSIGLFLDQEIQLVRGPILVGTDYVLDREIVALGESRKTESYWVRTEIHDAVTDELVAVTLLHQGLLKDSYPDYPKD